MQVFQFIITQRMKLLPKPYILACFDAIQGVSDEAWMKVGKETLCDAVTIPMSGQMESLNVAVAGGVMMYILNPPKQT